MDNLQWLTNYQPLICAMAVMAGLMILQLLIADFVGIRAKHKPGATIEADHAVFLFRASRALANTNESIAIFILLATSGILAQAHSGWLCGTAWIYVAGRIGHMLMYYANQSMLRSVFFGVSVIGLILMLGGVILALC